ncbi:MAG TPA: DNA polymerase III subunit gamma/tau [Bdellovibrionales bacterium]|nr:DNA polymerase III subunit gamma/tau [Bdellovibrionales bacterium]
MSYQVIARRWRPQTFQELVGQDHVSQTLLNALKSERLPHALLFTGPRGVGKTSSARLLSKTLKCTNSKNFVPCNKCNVCEEITSGSSLDVLEIDGASHNGVEAIRELRETVGYMPAQGKYKIYIIDEVHMLSTSAFNALLKTIEEPPAHVIFIFATTEPQKIPVTILSRCQRFDFRRIPTRLIMEQLQTICEKEKVKAEPEALWVIARQADGSLRDSQSLLDQIITFADAKITLQKTIEVLGLTDRAMLVETLESLVERSPQKAMQIVERLYFTGCDPKVFLQELIEEIRHLLIVKMLGSERPAVVDLPDSEIEHLRKLSSSLSEEDLHLLFDMALKGGQDFLRSQDPRLVLEMLLLRMSQAPRIESLFALSSGQAPAPAREPAAPKPEFKRPSGPSSHSASSQAPASGRPSAGADTNEMYADDDEEPPEVREPAAVSAPEDAPPVAAQPGKPRSWAERVTAAPAAGPAKLKVAIPPNGAMTGAPKAAPAPKPKVTAGDLVERWAQFVQQLRRKAPALGAKLEHVAPLLLSETELTLGVAKEKKFLCEQLAEPKLLREIEEHLKTHWGYSLTLKCHQIDSGQAESPHDLSQRKVSDKNNAIKKEVEAHPLIQKAQKTFKAQIKSIKENETATVSTGKGENS